jgi:acyl-coenzyme A synthetase/AMP-(fatty) acid ligase
MSVGIPLLHHAPDGVVVRVAGRSVDRDTFLTQASALALRLPAAKRMVLLCADRHRFLLAFCAAQLRGQTVLLPPDGSRSALSQLAMAYPDAYIAADVPPHDAPLPCEVVEVPPPASAIGACDVPCIAADHVAAILYTSGSTSRPRAHPKRWGELVSGAEHTLARLTPAAGSTVVATIPAQHMFGLETSILLPLQGGLATAAECPFFPADVAATLRRQPQPPILVTTPMHLRAFVSATLRWPPVAFLLSATAPLPLELARSAEAVFAAPVMEIFGSTETGAIATRRSIDGDEWLTLDGTELVPGHDGVQLRADHLPTPVSMTDRLDLRSTRRFAFRGRHDDMVKIAGKRASLADLDRRLLGVPGVQDGAFVQLDEDRTGVRRMGALVVAPQVDESAILRALADQLDPVFLPRRLRRVHRLPRNATGKLPRKRMLALLVGHGDDR